MRSLMRFAVFGLVLAACSGDFCDRRADLAESCGQRFTEDDLQSCDDSLKECSRSDRRLLDEYADCLEEAGLLVCEGTDDDGALNDYLTCAAPLLEVSDSCFDAFSRS